LVEPLAADFRSDRDGERLGLLKLVSGVLGISLDALIQRDAHRRMQRVTAVTAGALAAMLAMGVLTVFAINARHEAERQRGQAEGLVDYMLTDLREKLKGVGRLDIMTAVNRRALAYYDGEVGDLSPTSQAQRARILQALGEDDENRGDYRAALKKFSAARATTSALLEADPANPVRIFDHAQSEYWIGSLDFQQEKYLAAKPRFLEYKRLTDKLVAREPNNTKFETEVALAESNLCAVALRQKPHDPPTAVHYCSDALAHAETASRGLPRSDAVADDLTDRHAWLADAFYASGEFAKARSQRLEEEKILARRISGDPKNMDLRDSWVVLQRALAKLDLQKGDFPGAKSRFESALTTVEELIKFDSANNEWVKLRKRILNDIDRIQNVQKFKREGKQL